MTDAPTEILLHRVDPTRNMARFYRLSIEPNLFGAISLLRSWGRIGNRGQTRVELFDAVTEAERAFTRIAGAKRRRGYLER